jgi:hypothetical protein
MLLEYTPVRYAPLTSLHEALRLDVPQSGQTASRVAMLRSLLQYLPRRARNLRPAAIIPPAAREMAESCFYRLIQFYLYADPHSAPVATCF